MYQKYANQVVIMPDDLSEINFSRMSPSILVREM